jgi:hypothetical protein
MKKDRIIFSLRPQLAEWLRKRAQDSGRTVSAEVEWSLEQFSIDCLREGMQNTFGKGKKRG